jgi:biotin operon repressor
MTRAAFAYESCPDEELRRELLRDHLSTGKGAAMREHAYETAFRCWYSMGPRPAHLLLLLYMANGKPLSVRDLATDLNTTKEALHQHIWGLRRSLDTEAIDRTEGGGYRLSEDGLAECRAVLWQVGESLRMAS